MGCRWQIRDYLREVAYVQKNVFSHIRMIKYAESAPNLCIKSVIYIGEEPRKAPSENILESSKHYAGLTW